MTPPRTINSLEDLRDSSLKAGIEDILIDRAYVAVSTIRFVLKRYGFWNDITGVQVAINLKYKSTSAHLLRFNRINSSKTMESPLC